MYKRQIQFRSDSKIYNLPSTNASWVTESTTDKWCTANKTTNRHEPLHCLIFYYRMNDFWIEIVLLPISVDQNRIGIGKKNIHDDLIISKVICINDSNHWLKHHFVVKLNYNPALVNWHGVATNTDTVLPQSCYWPASFTVVFQWPILVVVIRIGIKSVNFLAANYLIGSNQQKVNRPFSIFTHRNENNCPALLYINSNVGL